MQYKLHFHVAEEFILNGGKGLILDVGAGTGALAQALLQKGKFSIEATDISEEMLKVAETKKIYERSFLSDFTEEFPLTDRMLLTVTFSYSTLESSPIPISVLTVEGSTVSHLEREEE